MLPIRLTALLFFCLHSAHAQRLVTYPVPKEVIYSMHNDDYTVRVRQPGGAWQDLYEYKVRVDMDKVQEASMVQFDFSGTVEVMVRKNNEKLQSVTIRPEAPGTQPVINGNCITFTLRRPGKFSVECNGDKRRNLHVFANAMEVNKPLASDTNVIWFGPGLHVPEDTVRKAFDIPSNKTVYLQGGAILRGGLVCNQVTNVRIIGRGIVDQAQDGVLVAHSTNVLVDGITFINPRHYTVQGGASQQLTIRNIKSFSCQGWSDGIDLMSCSDVTIDDVFLRNSDDCIAIYGHRWKYYGNARNYTITNSILWADVAHPINIGIHGNSDTIENIVFKNIHILEHDEDDPEYQGCMAITCGDLNVVRRIRFENIHIADFEEGQLFNIRVVYNARYNTAPGRSVQDVIFKNIHYNGCNVSVPVISGLDDDHFVDGMRFENLLIDGKPVTHFQPGPFTRNVKFLFTK